MALNRNGSSALASDQGMGLISHRIFGRVEPSIVVARRRHNFLRLWDTVRRSEGQVKPLYNELPEGVCPVGFPVLVEGRDSMRRALSQRGVGVRMFWDVLPIELRAREFPDIVYLSQRVLVLPVHQDIGDRLMDYLVETLEDAWKKR
tara:strand:+ start:95 stop:535 length:441 start_codon:yes stop_codon:yes gene_type:complete